MRTVTVENNKIVVEADGAKVRYDLRIVRKRIASLLQDLEEWRKYESLLTQRHWTLKQACPAYVHDFLRDKAGHAYCFHCGERLQSQ